MAPIWDLVLHQGNLVITMAGTHQHWLFHLSEGTIEPCTGTDAEALNDGPLNQAALAQPCGITSDHDALFFSDIESQVIR